ncbi:carbohydrate ABC transporter permease [Microbacterium dauci]|uniref:Carbohydrate ABC transporter permease n=1 Tax=Microbacterium dauci TaxID=3048008 RepID=A0ABT6ZE81_9MICO|nr:carbohydrate ABC transporter permease [Microbacterium sp. LX3-4]MDJ1114470.1 carbohydrate ABC transporter permease [Microbacterium sp. LX3-4]
MIAAGLCFAFPFYIFATVALKPASEVARDPLAFPSELHLDNFHVAWERADIGQALYNSTVIAAVSVVALVAFGSAAAYAIARRGSRLSNVAYLLFLLGLMVPLTLGMTPLYQLMRDWNLLQTYTSVILFSVGSQLPITIFLYAGFLRTLPREYEEAAHVDGAGPFATFRRVVFPMLRPVTGTVIILAAINIWNDFLTPLLYLGGSRYETLPVAISRFQGEFSTDWGVIFAGMAIAIAPVLVVYFLLQKHIIKGFASGLKG